MLIAWWYPGVLFIRNTHTVMVKITVWGCCNGFIVVGSLKLSQAEKITLPVPVLSPLDNAASFYCEKIKIKSIAFPEP